MWARLCLVFSLGCFASPPAERPRTPVSRAPVAKPAVAPAPARPPAPCVSNDECASRCEAGEGTACTTIALRYHEGVGIAKDPAKAEEMFTRACEAKDPEGCYQLGLGWGSDASSLERFRFACEAKHADACAELGYAYSNGKGITPDPVRARELAERACDGGSRNGCANLSIYLLLGRGGPIDLARAATVSRKACDAGDGNACSRLADLYEDGRGVTKDLIAARRISQRACDHGGGCNNLGVLYMKGIGGDADPKKAKELFEAACKNDEPTACVNVGKIWRNGDIDDLVDSGKAVEYFELACKGGDQEGCKLRDEVAADARAACEREARKCNNWGYMNEKGYGVQLSRQAAIKIYERACKAGSSRACMNLGYIYSEGTAVPLDRKKARRYYERACKLNDDEGCTEAAALRAKPSSGTR